MSPEEKTDQPPKRQSSFRSALCTPRSALILIALLTWPFLFDGFNPDALKAFISFGPFGPAGLLIFLMILIAIAAIPPIAGPVHRLLLRLRDATHRRRIICSIATAICTSGYLYLTALAQHRQLFPIYHDEFSYLIQARQFAAGHLWMPAHPLAKFFDSFQLLVAPVYASAYFPGTAMLNVPGIWLHLPPYVTSLAIAGAVAGIFFWITTELLDGLAGWLAVLLLLADSQFRQQSIMTLAQLPLLLYALLAVVAWLRWRTTGKLKWALFIGIFLGLAAITRPVDALCFALPVGTATIFSKRAPVTRAAGPCPVQVPPACAGGAPHQRNSLIAILAGALPFLCLQLFLNHNITGHWLQTPFTLYADRDYPGTAYGFHPFDPSARPASPLPQKQRLYLRDYRELIRNHTPANIARDLFPYHLRKTLSQFSQPYPLLVLLCPLCLLRLTKPRAVLLASLPLFLLFYAAYVFFLPHYVMVAAPAVIIAILTGAKAISTQTDAGSEVRRRAGSSPAKPGSSEYLRDRRLRAPSLALTLFIAGQAIASLPQWTAAATDDAFDAPLLKSVNEQLAHLPHRPAVVLFTFDPKRNLAEEPVYNADVAWPDDAEVIRAHDLGPVNRELFEYYASRQPQRVFFRFDEATKALIPLDVMNDFRDSR